MDRRGLKPRLSRILRQTPEEWGDPGKASSPPPTRPPDASQVSSGAHAGVTHPRQCRWSRPGPTPGRVHMSPKPAEDSHGDKGNTRRSEGRALRASTPSAIRTRSDGQTKVHSKEERQGSDTLKWLPQKISASSGRLENSGGDVSCCKALPTRIYGRKSDVTEVFHPARQTYWV